MGESLVQDDVPIAKGSEIGGIYLVHKKLGEGGMGSVYLAQNLKIQGEAEAPLIAIKLMTDADMSQIERFARERDLMLQVDHPNVVKCLDFGKHGTKPFLVLEFVAGGSLYSLIEKQSFSEVEAAWIVWQTIAGLRAVGTVHRDMKPENLLVQPAAGTRVPKLIVGDIVNGAVVKVADWGLAMARVPTQQRLTLSSAILGTPYYMAPEQIKSTKHVGIQVDMYALGCILYELLHGDPPFMDESQHGLLAKHLTEMHSYPTASKCSVPMRAFIDRCLAKDPGDRFQTWRLMQEQLRPLLGLPETWRYLESEPEESATAGKGSSSWLRRIFSR